MSALQDMENEQRSQRQGKSTFRAHAGKDCYLKYTKKFNKRGKKQLKCNKEQRSKKTLPWGERGDLTTRVHGTFTYKGTPYSHKTSVNLSGRKTPNTVSDIGVVVQKQSFPSSLLGDNGPVL